MTYSRALLPPSAADEALLAPIREEMRRRAVGPICAQCGHSPLDEHELPPLVPGDSRPVSRVVRTFRCEVRGRNCHADSGHNCSHFVRRSR